MSSNLLEPAGEISTHFRCDNCGLQLDKIIWLQCRLCQAFDLCSECGQTEYDQLPSETLNDHQKSHPDVRLTKDCLREVFVADAEINGFTARKQRRREEYERIVAEKRIENDYDMAVVMEKLIDDESLPRDDSVNSLIVNYFLKANKRNIRVLSLDGGGVRGYMPIKILNEFITQQYLPDIGKLDANNPDHKKSFVEAQKEFTKQFDYLVGTSTGGLIAFCLAINYNILDMQDIYSNANYYFKKNFFGPLFISKYDPSRIHRKIDEIIDQIVFPGDKKLSAKNATLLDIRNLLNPHDIIDEEKLSSAIFTHGNYLEFVDDSFFTNSISTTSEGSDFYQVKREKVLMITAYNTTDNSMMIFNTSYSKHWGYRIADVLKSTMAAPTYFPPQQVYRGIQHNGQFIPGKKLELYIDGGVFANDPELTALWAIRMQWKKQANYHLLSIGTGCYTSPLSSSTWGGYMAWILDNGYLVNTLMDATRSFTEIVGSNLAKFNNMRRMKLNYNITESMPLDDPDFARKFDQEWERLKNESDYKAFVFFFKNYIIGNF